MSGRELTPRRGAFISRLLALAVLGGGLVWLASRTAAPIDDDDPLGAHAPIETGPAAVEPRFSSPSEIATAVEASAPRRAPVEALAPAALAATTPAHGLMVRVVDEAGAGLLGITVVAVRSVDFAKGLTDGDGAVWLDCSAGEYQVTAYDANDESLYASRQIERVVVEEAGPARITLTLFRALARVEAFVCDDSGRPLAGIQLEGSGHAPERSTGVRVTDGQGLATWDPVAGGEWTVGVVPGESTADLVVADELVTVTVEPTGTTRMPITLVRQGQLIVRLTDVSSPGELFGLIAASAQDVHELSLASARPGSAGEMVFTWALPPDDYAVVASWKPGSDYWSPPERATVRPGEATAITVRTQLPSIRLSGRVHDPSGTGVPWELVSAHPPRSKAGGALDAVFDALVVRYANCDEYGNWSLAVPWESSLLGVDLYGTVGRHFAERDGLIEVSEASQPIDILVQPGCILDGRVVGRAAVEQTSPRLELALERDGHTPVSRRVRVQAGTFELRHAGAGSYTARLWLDEDYVSAPVVFEVAEGFREGETIPVTLEFTN